MKQYAVTAMGELLVEFQQQSDNQYTLQFGGNPAAVVCVPAKYGIKSALIGSVGSDHLGHCWTTLLQQYGVDTSFLKTAPNSHTNLSFIHKPPQEDAVFEFIGHPSSGISKHTLPIDLLKNTNIFHADGLSLIEKNSREAVWEAISIARQSDALISFCVNYDPSRWTNTALARDCLLYGIKEAELAMLTQQELDFLGVEPMDLLHNYSSHCILISTGSRGYRYVTRELEGYVQGGGPIQMIDPSGHFDIFMGTFLYSYSQQEKPLKELNQAELEKMLCFANDKAILSTMKEGSILSIPDL